MNTLMAFGSESAPVGFELAVRPDRETENPTGRTAGDRGRRARDESRLGGHAGRAGEDLAAVPLDVVEGGERLAALWFVERPAE